LNTVITFDTGPATSAGLVVLSWEILHRAEDFNVRNTYAMTTMSLMQCFSSRGVTYFDHHFPLYTAHAIVNSELFLFVFAVNDTFFKALGCEAEH
jgi:hypothetical protein